jgi:hypothetical protein
MTFYFGRMDETQMHHQHTIDYQTQLSPFTTVLIEAMLDAAWQGNVQFHEVIFGTWTS